SMRTASVNSRRFTERRGAGKPYLLGGWEPEIGTPQVTRAQAMRSVSPDDQNPDSNTRTAMTSTRGIVGIDIRILKSNQTETSHQKIPLETHTNDEGNIPQIRHHHHSDKDHNTRME